MKYLKLFEKYKSSEIHITPDIDPGAFNTYYREEVWGKLCGDNINKKDAVIELLNQFIQIVNEEFESDVSISDDDVWFSIIEPFDNKDNKDISSSNPGSFFGQAYPGKENSIRIWEKLKYGYKPGYIARMKLPIDEELKNKRWSSYYQKVLNGLNKIPNTKIYVYIGDQVNDHIPLYVYIRYEDFEFKDPFDKENVIEFLQNHPEHINALYKFVDKDEIFNFLLDNPKVLKNLTGQNLLDFTKKQKSINNPSRRQMEEENQMYVFIARPSFKEKPDGGYEKDIDIENLVPIDPYNSKDIQVLSMMKLRARMQSNDSNVYCIWLPKDFEEDLSNINDDEMTYLRSSIDQKKERI